MTPEEHILELFNKYFETADKGEIQDDVNYITSLGTSGITFEEYIDQLNRATAISLVETGLCDDIAYADLFESLISDVTMDEISNVKTSATVDVSCGIEDCSSKWQFGESNFAMAA